MAARSPKVTIKDVAEAAGVSIATVSNALNGTGRLSGDRREAILTLARKMRFRPNVMAKALMQQRSLAIGLLTNDTYGRFSFPVMSGISEALVDHGVSVFLSTIDEDPARARAHLDALLDRRIDGLIISGRRADLNIPIDLSDVDVPVVYALTASPSGHAHVAVDDLDGSRQATGRLHRLGRRRITHVTGPESHLAARARADGYRQAIGHQGRVLFGRWSEDWGHEAVERLWSAAGDPPDAISCGSDQIARGVIDALRERDIAVPSSVAVVGFDNWEIVSQATRPPLTTVDMNLKELGRQAGLLVLGMSRGDLAPDTERTVPCSLVVRQSCGTDPTRGEGVGSSS
jgi:LacI family transcriptional regulator